MVGRGITSGDVLTVYLRYIDDSQKGKRRPVLLIESEGMWMEIFKITSKYQEKSPRIRRFYYEIQDWKAAGLKKPSWIDVSESRKIKEKSKRIGQLSLTDI